MRIHSVEEITRLTPIVLAEIDRQNPFSSFRPGQKMIIFNIVKTYLEGKKFFILEAPTGTGKSVIAYIASKVITSLFSPPEKTLKSLICTKTKALQNQYGESFYDVPTLWAASGYECNQDPWNPESYYGSHNCTKKLCSMYEECKYRVAKNRFLAADIGVMNYAYFLHMAHYSPNIMTLDEAHTLEFVLCDHLGIKLNPEFTLRNLENLRDFRMVSDEDIQMILLLMANAINIEDRKEGWFQIIKSIMEAMRPIVANIVSEVAKTKEAIETGSLTLQPHEKKALYFNGNAITSLLNKIEKIIGSNVEWVISEREHSKFSVMKPISLTEEAGMLFKRSKFVILMSATLCGIPVFARSLGLDPEDYNSVQLDSTVPVENRQIVSVGLPTLSRDTKDTVLPLYVNVLDELIDQVGEGNRGIIHSVSYENANYVVANSKHARRMRIPTPQEMLNIEDIMTLSPEMILVSPSIIEGIDLKGDLCRFQFFLKVPFPYLGDKWVSRKKDINNDWYLRKTIEGIVQGAGRGVRGDDDYAITFVLDGAFNRLSSRSDLMPVWFSSAIKQL